MMASIFLDLLSIQNDYDQKEAGVMSYDTP